jgi:trehalose/maltose hydrolase-like predicted phosphorylase
VTLASDQPGLRLAPWSIVYERFLPQHEGAREALCTLGNGRFATRGACSLRVHDGAAQYPGTYAAGIYDRASCEVNGERLDYEELVNLPNWLALSVTSADDDARPIDGELIEYERELELKRGLLIWRIALRDASGGVLRIEERRWVHMAEAHLAGQRFVIEAEGFRAPLRFALTLDGAVDNTNANEYIGLDRRHLQDIETGDDGRELTWLHARTRGSRSDLVVAARQRAWLQRGGVTERVQPARVRHAGERVGFEIEATLERGARLTLEKLVSLYTSRDPVCTEPHEQALRLLTKVQDFDVLERTHARLWARWWRGATLEVPEPRILSALRLNMFHLLQTVSAHTVALDAGVPARGLHGENYHGHIFWDELFIAPILNLRWPELTRGLLMYRYRRLAEARFAARALGLRGAMFPWRSASDGREVTDRLRRNPKSGRFIADHSHLQRHINAAIAYNVWHYVEVSGDLAFLYAQGAEMIFSIAQFWASAARLEDDGRYHVRGVVGPDEFHDAYPGADRPGLNDNAYTNIMAVWCVLRALDVAQRLPRTLREPLLEQLEIAPAELEHWADLTRRMYVPWQRDGVIIDQFAGFEALEPFAWDRYRARYGNIQRLDNILEAEGDSVNRYQICKQADVLMLFYVLSHDELTEILQQLGYDFSPDAYRRNVHYYLARTSHGSTLSRVVHAWVLTRLDREGSWKALTEALGSDLCDIQGGSTREGIHLGAMAGTIDVFQRAYLGLEVRSDKLVLAPRLPPEIPELQLRLRYRTQWFELRVSDDELQISSEPEGEGAVIVEVAGQRHEITPGTSRTISTGRAHDRVG